jgi:hypothetical protein
MSRNIHLQFKFTDRAGRLVYEMHDAEDNKRLMHPMGKIVIPQGHDLHTAASIDWYCPVDHGAAPEQLELPLRDIEEVLDDC